MPSRQSARTCSVASRQGCANCTRLRVVLVPSSIRAHNVQHTFNAIPVSPMCRKLPRVWRNVCAASDRAARSTHHAEAAARLVHSLRLCIRNCRVVMAVAGAAKRPFAVRRNAWLRQKSTCSSRLDLTYVPPTYKKIAEFRGAHVTEMGHRAPWHAPCKCGAQCRKGTRGILPHTACALLQGSPHHASLCHRFFRLRTHRRILWV